MAGARQIVVSVRLDPGSVHVLDLLVGSGIARSRSEATARLVQIGISASGKLLEAAREIANKARLLREEFGSADEPLEVVPASVDAEGAGHSGEKGAADIDAAEVGVEADVKDDEEIMRPYRVAVERLLAPFASKSKSPASHARR